MICCKKRKDLTDKIVLVTGGANGLGKELALKFAQLGCTIAIADLDIENAEKTMNEIVTQGSVARAYKVDVSQLVDIENLKLQIEQDLGIVDIVINNAAILYTKSIETEDPKELEKIINVNIMSVIWTTRVFLGEMKRRKTGHIVTICSMAGLVGSRHLHSYSTTKFAVRGFMDALYLKLNGEGYGNCIKTTTVFPWFINTNENIEKYATKMYKYCDVLKMEDVVKKVVDGVRRNKRIVTIPGYYYLFVLKMFCCKRRKDLTDKVVLVTGGANGLGKAIALRFAEFGCKIAIADLDTENAEKTVKEILTRATCIAANAYKVDVSSLEEIENLKQDIEKDLGIVDIVVNNAGMLHTKSIEKEDPKILEKIIQVNLMSVIWTTRVFLGEMKRRKSGHIISISSTAGLVGSPNLHSYSTTKFAVRGFMDSLFIELNQEGYGIDIRTTTVYPWFINTNDSIKKYTNKYFKYCVVYEAKDVANRIVSGMRCNERVITIPGFFYLFGYVIECYQYQFNLRPYPI
uniref:Short-chain dehydrogenase/reductase 3 n=1 Tax=Culicoides sonorensis TaxID=179676 RepID=A0A336MY38_CULSO